MLVSIKDVETFVVCSSTKLGEAEAKQGSRNTHPFVCSLFISIMKAAMGPLLSTVSCLFRISNYLI
jgi:hypothetical protein